MSTKSPTILLIENDQSLGSMLKDSLELKNYQVDLEHKGDRALQLFQAAKYDIILMDVEMPVKDGIQALREIRKSVRYGHVPVIMITSRTGLKHRAMAQAAGCNGYMGKPFNFRMLVGQINELTGHRLELS